MNIFISWSGDASHSVAQILRTWLPSALQYVTPYLSSEDIPPGVRWSHDIAQRLEEISFGIICVTNDNAQSPWLNFEAGAISKSVDLGHVAPFLFGISPAELTGPLAQFQATRPQIEDVRRLLALINSLSGQPLDERRLAEATRVWWPRLADKLERLRKQEALRSSAPERDLRDIAMEVLQISRGLQRKAILERASEWVALTGAGIEGGIEAAKVDDFILLRNSKDKTGPTMIYSTNEWEAFIGGVRDGEFDVQVLSGPANLSDDVEQASPEDENDSDIG